MTLSRRALIASVPLLGLAGKAKASDDSRLSPRVIGNPDAKILVQEWFSLDCSHCAHFATTVFPEVKAKLIDTGKIRYQFNDCPRYQLSVYAAMVARSLPQDRYEPFLMALFSSQEAWAFANPADGADALAPLRQRAALAGVSHAQFDAIVADHAFAEALYSRAQADLKTYNFHGTPYFRFGNVALEYAPATYDHFVQILNSAL